MNLPKLSELRVGFIQNLSDSFAVRREHRNAGPNVVGYRDGLKQEYEFTISRFKPFHSEFKTYKMLAITQLFNCNLLYLCQSSLRHKRFNDPNIRTIPPEPPKSPGVTDRGQWSAPPGRALY